METQSDPTRDALYELLFDELVMADKPGLVADLVLGAFEGPEALDSVLGGLAAPRIEPRRQARPGASEIPGLFLKSISVRRFRGVGAARTLALRPGPGLTLVTGRNGSGKSSFAEAAELALTGTNERVQRGRIWKDGWRNLHNTADAPRIEVELTAEGASRPLRVVREWPKDSTDLFGATTTVHSPGAPPRPLAELSWQHALTDYRPFLAYSELSGLITDGNARIFDALGSILGLDDLTQADRSLQQACSKLDGARKEVREGRSALLADLAASPDPRAAPIRAALGSSVAKHWDLDAAEAAVRGGAGAADAVVHAGGKDPADDENALLRQLAALSLPETPEVVDRARALRDAAARVAALAGTPAADARRVAALLRAGLDHYREHGDGLCPLCRTGTLDDAWRTSAEAEAERLTELAKDADAADAELRRARAAALALVHELPPVLAAGLGVAVSLVDGSVSAITDDAVLQAQATWQAWARLHAETGTETQAQWLADELVARHKALAAALDPLRSSARARLEMIETAWAPLARRVLDWVDAARTARDQQPLLDALKDARGFLGSLTERLRDERLAPFAEQCAAIWAELRQESNVELGPIRLRGTNTRRRLVLDVTVDGADGAALGVMSQGELHALGLALFLPRATVPDSPFRFVVIDDPVQAMDPAKVDGLARVLLRTAQTRQVVVFTHDDRLADAVRRFSPRDVPVYWEVVRREQSEIEIVPVLDPARRCLDEAWALARTDNLPEDIKASLVPAFCKSAVDAVCNDIFRRRRLSAGERHHNVEEMINKAPTTLAKAALAIYDDVRRQGEVLSYINRKWGRAAGDTFKTVKEAGHKPWGGDYTALVRETRTLVGKLEELR